MRLQGRTLKVSSTPKSSSTAYSVKQNQGKPLTTTLHVQKVKDCTHCHDGSHPLYLCAAFKAISVEDRNNAVSSLRVCTNCLSYNHLDEIVLVAGHAENVATAITHFSIVSDQHLAQQQRIALPVHQILQHPLLLTLPLLLMC